MVGGEFDSFDSFDGWDIDVFDADNESDAIELFDEPAIETNPPIDVFEA